MTPSVIGLDVGSSTCFVAKVENGGVELLTNELNSRSTPTIVSVPSRERGTRSVGALAESHLVTQPNSSVAEVTGLLGVGAVDLRSHREYPKLKASQADQKVGVKLLFREQEKIFRPEQLVASVLCHLKKIVAEDSENRLNEANSNYYVLSAPNYFTDVERSALLDAARIAQLNVVQMTNDLTAAALAYGYFQKNLPTAPLAANDVTNGPAPAPDHRVSAPPIAERPRLVVFADFGHSGIQSGLVALSSEGFKVLATQTDRSVGGRYFDDRLARYFMDAFNAQHRAKGVRLTPETHPKVYAKLLNVAEKTKRQMSANRNVLPVVVECLSDDLDLNVDVCREKFEQMCADLFERVRNCFVRLIQRSRLARGSLHSVEILGGSSRIPKFKSLVEEVFEVAPSTTLNADEAVARGCALMCALNTKIFKVRPFHVVDTVHYTSQVKYSCVVQDHRPYAVAPASQFGSSPRHGGTPALHTQTKKVFVKNCPSSSSMRSFVELEDFPHSHTLALEYCVDDDEDAAARDCQDLRNLTKPLIAIYNLDKEVAPREGEKLQLEFHHYAGGIVQMTAARLVQAAKRVKSDDSNGRERNIRFTEIRLGGLTEQQIADLTTEESLMEDTDAKERIREEMKNRLEEFTFSLRDDLENLDDFVKKEEAWAIVFNFASNLINQFELDGYDNYAYEAYKAKLEEVQTKKTVFMIWLTKFKKKLELEQSVRLR